MPKHCELFLISPCVHIYFSIGLFLFSPVIVVRSLFIFSCVSGMLCSARLNMLHLRCALTRGQRGYFSTYHDIRIVCLPKNGLHCNVCLSTVIINKISHICITVRHVGACSFSGPVFSRRRCDPSDFNRSSNSNIWEVGFELVSLSHTIV